jgi:hypothetical protein
VQQPSPEYRTSFGSHNEQFFAARRPPASVEASAGRCGTTEPGRVESRRWHVATTGSYVAWPLWNLSMLSPRLARLTKRSAIGLVCLAILLAVGMGGVYAWRWHTFPYGFSHCCLKQLGTALRSYAEEPRVPTRTRRGRERVFGGAAPSSPALLPREARGRREPEGFTRDR